MSKAPKVQRIAKPASAKRVDDVVKPSLSAARPWAFRFAAAVVLPLTVLGLLELGLRVVGVGYPTRFFVNRTIKGRRVFVENDQFGLRFFPPELARSPSPLVMETPKPKDACRIFILGESAALGDPEPAFGFGRYLQVLLQGRFPRTHFEVVCTAMTAINSHALVPIARECAQHQGDVWVLYMGNNEFVGPFGPSTIFGPQVPPLSLIRLGLALKSTRVGQLLARFASKASNQKTWGGMKMFLDHQVPPDDPRKQKVYDYFQANLDDILASARTAGAKVILSTVAVNLKDCAPFASQHSTGLLETQHATWQQLYDSTLPGPSANTLATAISNSQAAAQIDPCFAELQFRWAQFLLSLTNMDEAMRHFELARDFDSLPFRADNRLNALIRETAAKHTAEGVSLVDGATLLAAQSPTGIVGKESLYEHVHLNFEGNYHLARAIAETVSGLLPNTANSGAQRDWASFDQCSRQLALTDWDRRRVYESLLHRLAEPPFVNQMNHADQMDSLKHALATVRARQTPEALQEARTVYREATAAAPGDFYLRADFAKLEEDVGDLPEAITQWRAVCDEIPFGPGPHYYLGRVLARQGQSVEALQELDWALAIRPDLSEALEEKGRLLVRIKQPEAGLKVLEKAAALEPENARMCFDRAEALAAVGRRPEALDELQRAVQLQPAYWEARYLLGVEFALKGDLRPASEQFLETVRLNPAYGPGHLNLGIALAKLDKPEEAMLQFQEALRLDPKNQKAAEYLKALQASRARQRKPQR